MNLKLDNRKKKIQGSVTIPGSKSESNRYLILKKMYSKIEIFNLSNSEDTLVLQKALFEQDESHFVDIGHTGTAMRFLTAYYAIQYNTDVYLTGSERMQKRPIKELVDTLRELGASIVYDKELGFPPLRIRGKTLVANKVCIKGNISSQFITALLLIAPKLPEGLTLEVSGELFSRPYVEMTIQLLNSIGITTEWNENIIKIYPEQTIEQVEVIVESDWSSASYFYSLVALSSMDSQIVLNKFFKISAQGDSAIVDIYEKFGVYTEFKEHRVVVSKSEIPKKSSPFIWNLNATPDVAQTIIVTCLGLKRECFLTGLETLKIKETDRLVALKNELEKFGAQITLTQNSIHMLVPNELTNDVFVQTYLDHRMAMAFAPLSVLVPIEIEDFEVVSKSYPDFWKHLNNLD